MTLFEALTGGAFDRLNWQHSGEFDQNIQKSQMPGGLHEGGWAVFGIDRYINILLNILLCRSTFCERDMMSNCVKHKLDTWWLVM